jgi:hypothetical protein
MNEYVGYFDTVRVVIVGGLCDLVDKYQLQRFSFWGDLEKLLEALRLLSLIQSSASRASFFPYLRTILLAIR